MKKHKIWAIGWTGDKVCYLDMEKEEALRRYKKDNEEIFEGCDGDVESQVEVDLVEFDDEFNVYDIGDEIRFPSTE